MTGGQLVVEALIQMGVKDVFGIPGVHTLEIYDALYHRSGEIQHVVTRHEGGAGFMADGYARATGDIGVALVITGPGVTNATTPLGQAFSDSSPVLLISSQNETAVVDRDVGALHQLKDQLSVTAGCTAWNRRVERPEDIPQAIFDAVRFLRTQRPRPVHLEIPLDVLEASVTMTVERPELQAPTAPSATAVEQAEALLKAAERPLIWAGGGALGADVKALAHRLQAPVVTTVAGKGVIPEDDPLALGNWVRADGFKDVLASTDLVLVLGSELSAIDTDKGTMPFPETLIRVDRVNEPVRLGYVPRLMIPSDVKPFVEAVLKRLGNHSISRRPEYLDRATRLKEDFIKEQRASGDPMIWAILDVLREALRPEDIFVGDMTMLSYRAGPNFPVYCPRTYLFPQGFGTLGWALPAAIGAQLGRPDRRVISINGDGGFLFSCNELATAVKYDLPLVVLILNNECYGVVAQTQKRRYGRTYGTDIVNPDMVALAKAFGMRAERVETTEELKAKLAEGFSAKGPTLLELPVRF